MSRPSHKREKPVIKSEIHRDNGGEETAARTRPFSFDEIMLRRKKKKQSGELVAKPVEAENLSGKVYSEEIPDHSRSERGYRNSRISSSIVAKHPSEDFVKLNSKHREENTPVDRGKVKKKEREKEKESHSLEFKSRVPLSKDAGDKARGKNDRRDWSRRKNDDWLIGDLKNEHEKRHSRHLFEKERYLDRSRGRPEKEFNGKHRNYVEERKPEKDVKRKRRNSDEERSMQKNITKKHDSGKRHHLEVPERKGRMESSEFHKEETKPNKKRSRSREHDKDRGRRTPSLSPRSHRRTSNNVSEHGDMSSQSSKDRFKRQEADDERNRISNNGPNGQYRRHGGNTSGLGGYSPRKRRSEAGVKTPSPPHRSPEKKSAGWDLPPPGANINLAGPVIPIVQSLNQAVTFSTYELSSMAPVTPAAVRVLPGVFSYASVESVQLTQATRPMRRLYVENLPASASEKAVMECINNFLLSSGINRVPGSQPCISCSIHKEKGQALVEFLTPEDASAALFFDGRSFSGSVLKIRRPKDYVDIATGVTDKSVATCDSSSDTVRDSPHKIFVGGIPKVISSEMLREIVTAFGPLKAFHFEVNGYLDEPCAFLEYVDQSVSLKACAGLNGLRLGGRMLTVVQATPDASLAENIGNIPFYGIPEHAKPLLEKPTQILKLRNVLDPDRLLSLAEPELEEILEDVRIECARFGTVNSVNFVKLCDGDTGPEICREPDGSDSPDNEGTNVNENVKTEHSAEQIDGESQEISTLDVPSNNLKEHENDAQNLGNDGTCADKISTDDVEDEMSDTAPLAGSEKLVLNPSFGSPEINDPLLNQNDGEGDKPKAKADNMESELMVEENLRTEEVSVEAVSSGRMDMGGGDKDGNMETEPSREVAFEPGCILVEYKRTEASSVAAHCLHGRLYDDRRVIVEYVDYDTYRAKFPK